MMKRLIEKYKELILYVIFGGLTTAVNFIAFHLIERLGINYLINNAVSWFVAVVFAYITNKIFVFESKSTEAKVLVKEISEFFAARLFSFGIEEGGLWLLVDIIGMKSISMKILGMDITGAFIAKLILAVIVVILNYVFSKFIIFARKNKSAQEG